MAMKNGLPTGLSSETKAYIEKAKKENPESYQKHLKREKYKKALSAKSKALRA